MTNQQLAQKPSSETIGTFTSREAAAAAKQAIESAGIAPENISVSGQRSDRNQIEAMGTTVGGEAGFWVGGFYGGILGLVVTLSLTTWTSMPDNSNFGRLLILGFTVAGAVLGLLSGKRIHAQQSLVQKKKGDPTIPQSFEIIVSGSPEEIEKANSAASNSNA